LGFYAGAAVFYRSLWTQPVGHRYHLTAYWLRLLLFCCRLFLKTVGDCPDFSESAEKNGTVPFSETFAGAMNRKFARRRTVPESVR
jgi:hypothetical protein